jgi:hypothetical protein
MPSVEGRFGSASLNRRCGFARKRTGQRDFTASFCASCLRTPPSRLRELAHIHAPRGGYYVRPAISFCPIYLTNGSNDHCEQFDRSKSNHQHRDRYWIVIEPMLFLCIHDTPPCSSNFDDIRTQVSDRIAAGRYFFISSCWTSAVICGGTGAERASYWALR